MSASKCVVVLLAVLIAVCASLVAARDIPDDLDPRAQIAQHNREDGQLRAYGPDYQEDGSIYDEVSSEEDIYELESRPEFPQGLEFNFERNRVHKRIPVLEEEYDFANRQMDQINKEA